MRLVVDVFLAFFVTNRMAVREMKVIDRR